MKESEFQFINPYLEELHFNINPNFNTDTEELTIKNAFNVQIKRNNGENRANVTLTLETNLENENTPFKLQIKVSSDFIWTNLNESVVEQMLKLNAPALLLSYMRPIVANITNASNFPAYNIPFVNFKET